MQNIPVYSGETLPESNKESSLGNEYDFYVSGNLSSMHIIIFIFQYRLTIWFYLFSLPKRVLVYLIVRGKHFSV